MTTKDLGAGLIGQPIPDVDGTLPRPGSRLRVFGPSDNPDWPDCYLGDVDGDLSGLIENIKEYLPQMHPKERYVLRVQAMTDAEVEALPDL